MNSEKLIIVLCFGLMPMVGLMAQNKEKENIIGEQIADNTFFDPTKKEVKKEVYEFGVEYRLEAGYVQHEQRTRELSYPNMFLHGARVGATFTFKLPYHFGIETGLLYTLLCGKNEQHWRSIDAPSTQEEYIAHTVLEHNLTVPLRAFYVIPLWKELNLFFYGGPQLHMGMAETDHMDLHLSDNTKAWLESQSIRTESYDRLTNELLRVNIQMGVGGGLEWDRYRLQSGYDFGLNNRVQSPVIGYQYMSEWGWYVSFSYRF